MCSNVGLGTFFESGSYIDGCLHMFFVAVYSCFVLLGDSIPTKDAPF